MFQVDFLYKPISKFYAINRKLFPGSDGKGWPNSFLLFFSLVTKYYVCLAQGLPRLEWLESTTLVPETRVQLTDEPPQGPPKHFIPLTVDRLAPSNEAAMAQ